MKSAWVIARRDSSSYFQTWTGVIVMFFYTILSGIFFILPTLTFAKISIHATAQEMAGLPGFSAGLYIFNSFFVNMGNMLMVVIPFLSMRAIAEEKHLQTLELIFTYPVSDVDVVLGKFLGMVRFFITMTLSVWIYAVLIQAFGAAINWKTFLISYSGFLLLGTAYLALGLYISSLSPNSVISAVITAVLLICLWILDWAAGITDGSLAQFLSAISPSRHFQSFTMGILDLSDTAYFVFFALYFIFLTLRSIEMRNWEG